MPESARLRATSSASPKVSPATNRDAISLRSTSERNKGAPERRRTDARMSEPDTAKKIGHGEGRGQESSTGHEAGTLRRPERPPVRQRLGPPKRPSSPTTPRPLGPRCSEQPLARGRASYPVDPFVGLWGLPSLPYRTASCASRPPCKVHPVSLTAFPGVPARFPGSRRSWLLGAKRNLVVAPGAVKSANPQVRNNMRR